MINNKKTPCSLWKGVLRNFTKFTGKHLCQSLFFNKVAGLMPATLLKKRLSCRCFSVNFVKFLRSPFLQNTSRRLLLFTPCKISNNCPCGFNIVCTIEKYFLRILACLFHGTTWQDKSLVKNHWKSKYF